MLSAIHTRVAPPPHALRVLFVNDTPRNGGPGRSLLSILRFLDPARVHRAVLLPRPGVVADLLRQHAAADELLFLPDLVENIVAPLSRAMSRGDFAAPLPLRALRAAGNALRTVRGVAGLARLIDRGRYDLVYCNGTTADHVGALAAAAAGAPALWHVRYTSIPAVAQPLHHRLATSKTVRRIVCVSNAAAALFPDCAEKVAVVHNAVDLDELAPGRAAGVLRREIGAAPADIVFGSHGRVLRRKGYIEMVHAARRALDAMPPALAARCRFAVIGDTPEDFAVDHVAECRALADRLGLADRFRFLGFRHDVRPYVVDFDVAVVPSVYADPLPRAVIESMAAGVPVIAFAVGGVTEMLQDGATGALVPPADVGALAAAIARYAGDAAMRERQGRAARIAVEHRHDARTHARRIEAEIRAAVAAA